MELLRSSSNHRNANARNLSEPRSGSINNSTMIPDSFMNRGAVP